MIIELDPVKYVADALDAHEKKALRRGFAAGLRAAAKMVSESRPDIFWWGLNERASRIERGEESLPKGVK